MRRIARLEENAAAIDIALSRDELQRLETIAPVGRQLACDTPSR
jgi:aryl-alcohol dehydrogenase-like predicted oxidoreductase